MISCCISVANINIVTVALKGGMTSASPGQYGPHCMGKWFLVECVWLCPSKTKTRPRAVSFLFIPRVYTTNFACVPHSKGSRVKKLAMRFPRWRLHNKSNLRLTIFPEIRCVLACAFSSSPFVSINGVEVCSAALRFCDISVWGAVMVLRRGCSSSYPSGP